MTRPTLFLLGLSLMWPLAGFSRHPTWPEVVQLPSDPGLGSLMLQDADGGNFNLKQRRGRLVLIDFFFTSCATICRPQTAGLHKTWQKLDAGTQKSIAFVSIAIDPKRDTLEQLRAYRQRFGITTRSWTFATGSRETLQRFTQYFGSVSPERGPLEHKGRLYLIDTKGTYLTSFASAPALDSDRLALELTRAVGALARGQQHESRAF